MLKTMFIMALPIMASTVEWEKHIQCRFLDPVLAIEKNFGPDSIQISGTVANGIAELEYVQYFSNPYDSLLNLEYNFPLPANASVHNFKYETEDQNFVTQLMKKEEAQNLYDSLTGLGQQAALLSQVKPNIFAQNLANISALAKVKVTTLLSYPMEYQNGKYQLTFPTYIAPRFPSDGIGVPASGMAYNPADSLVAGEVRIDVLYKSLPVISSATHTLSQIVENTGTRIQFANASTVPNKDIILDQTLSLEEQTMNMSTQWSMQDSVGYFHFNLVPPDSLFDAEAMNEITFVIDRSGSQSGWPLEKQKAIAKLMVENLSTSSLFQVLAFDNYTDYSFSSPVLATAENKMVASAFIDKIYAAGGTELETALNELLARPLSGEYSRVIVLLTDGFITNEEIILGTLSTHASQPKLITYGMGGSVNGYFLDNAAQIGGGVSYHVSEISNTDSLAQLGSQMVSSSQVRLVELSAAGNSLFDFTEALPRSVFKGVQFNFFGKYSQGGAFKTCAKVEGIGNSIQQCRVFGYDQQSEGLASLPSNWAKQRIEKLEWQEQTTAVVDSIIELSLTYQVLSKYTSFIATEANNQEYENGIISYVNSSSNSTGWGTSSYAYASSAYAASSTSYYAGSPTPVLPTLFKGVFQFRVNSEQMSLSLSDGKILSFEIYDLSGAKLYSKNENQINHSSRLILFRSDVPELFAMQSTMVLRVKTDSGWIVHPFQLQNNF